MIQTTHDTQHSFNGWPVYFIANHHARYLSDRRKLMELAAAIWLAGSVGSHLSQLCLEVYPDHSERLRVVAGPGGTGPVIAELGPLRVLESEGGDE